MLSLSHTSRLPLPSYLLLMPLRLSSRLPQLSSLLLMLLRLSSRLPQLSSLLLMLLTLSSGSSALCPEQCRCRPRASDCSSARLSGIPIFLDPRIHVLRLGNNAISSVVDTLGFYPKLRELDLADNSLTSLGEQQLSLQQQLRQLQLANNQLSELRRGALEGLGRLVRLDLSGNLLTDLDDGVFRPTRRLRWLSLARNRIRTVLRDAFLGLGELESLDLSGNDLSHVSPASLRHLGSLQVLRLAGNQLTEIAFHAFFVLRSLRNLSLAGNSIGRIHAEAFAELHDLRVLDVSFNQLEAFPAQSLAPLRLEELDVGGNRFSSLMPRHLDSLPRLKVVRLCGSQNLTSVSGHVFSNNRVLEEVHLCENPQLKWLPRTAVESMRRLRVLNLGGNSLGSLENMTSLLQRVEVFNVSGNPLVCNCSARWLWELPRKLPNTSVVSPLVCAGSGRIMSSLRERDLDCGWWKTAAMATAASLLAAVCAALIAVLLVRRRRRQDRSRSSVYGATSPQEKVCPRLTPVVSEKSGETAVRGSHSRFTLLSRDYVTDRDRVVRGNYDVTQGNYDVTRGNCDVRCDDDYARVYDGAYVRDYAVKAPSVVV